MITAQLNGVANDLQAVQPHLYNPDKLRQDELTALPNYLKKSARQKSAIELPTDSERPSRPIPARSQSFNARHVDIFFLNHHLLSAIEHSERDVLHLNAELY